MNEVSCRQTKITAKLRIEEIPAPARRSHFDTIEQRRNIGNVARITDQLFIYCLSEIKMCQT